MKNGETGGLADTPSDGLRNIEQRRIDGCVLKSHEGSAMGPSDRPKRRKLRFGDASIRPVKSGRVPPLQLQLDFSDCVHDFFSVGVDLPADPILGPLSDQSAVTDLDLARRMGDLIRDIERWGQQAKRDGEAEG